MWNVEISFLGEIISNIKRKKLNRLSAAKSDWYIYRIKNEGLYEREQKM